MAAETLSVSMTLVAAGFSGVAVEGEAGWGLVSAVVLRGMEGRIRQGRGQERETDDKGAEWGRLGLNAERGSKKRNMKSSSWPPEIERGKQG